MLHLTSSQLVFGLLNIRSIANKLGDLLEVQADNSIDVFLLVEMWHHAESVRLLMSLSPSNSNISMTTHVSKTVSSCFAALRQIRNVKRSVTRPLLLSLVQSLVLTRLDYGNATLAEWSVDGATLSSSSSLFVQIKQYMMHNNEQMIKPEQDSKVEKPHLLLPLFCSVRRCLAGLLQTEVRADNAAAHGTALHCS